MSEKNVCIAGNLSIMSRFNCLRRILIRFTAVFFTIIYPWWGPLAFWTCVIVHVSIPGRQKI